jgi:CBS domain-containing protein
MLLVRHVMADDVKTASPAMDAYDAAGLMASYDIGSVPLVDAEGNLAGIVTDRDLAIRVLGAREDPRSVVLAEIGTLRSLVTVSPDARLSEARALMASERVRRLPVVKGTKLVGILSLGDLAVADSSQREVGDALRSISESPATLERSGGPDPGTPLRTRER